MNTLARRLIVILIIALSAAYLLLFIFSMATFPEKEFLPQYFVPWSVSNGLLLLAAFMLPLCFSIVLLTFGVFASPDSRKKETVPLHKSVSLLMIVFLVITTAYIILQEGFVPGILDRNADFKNKTAAGRSFLEDARQAKLEGKLQKSERFYNYYLQIDPDNRNIEAEKRQLLTRISEENQLEALRKADNQEEISQVRDLIEKARYYLDNGDYHSAHYYATLADSLDPVSPAPKQIQAQAMEKIREFDPVSLEQESFFNRKQEGYDAFNSGDFLRAYYIFRGLADEGKSDTDVELFLQKSREQMQGAAFFIDEADEARLSASSDPVLFLNRDQEDVKEAIFAGQAAALGHTIYLYDLEIAAWDTEGSVLYHFYAPYGKTIGDTLYTRAVDRHNESVRLESTLYQGTAPEITGQNAFVLQVTAAEIDNYSLDSSESLSQAAFTELLQMAEVFAERGRNDTIVYMEVYRRLINLFSFLILLFLAAGLGWRLGRRGSAGSLSYIMLVVLIPLLSYVIIQLYRFVSFNLLAFTHLLTGFGITLTALLLSQSIFFILVLFYLAGQKTD